MQEREAELNRKLVSKEKINSDLEEKIRTGK